MEPKKSLEPFTRRLIVFQLGTIAMTCILIEGWLAMIDSTGSDALMSICAGCVGAIAGMAVPHNGDSHDS